MLDFVFIGGGEGGGVNSVFYIRVFFVLGGNLFFIIYKYLIFLCVFFKKYK